MKDLGFQYVELEGVRRDNLLAVYEKRQELKRFCDGEGLKVVNFCPVLPDSVSLDKKKRLASWDLFKRAIEIAKYFGCYTIQGDSFTPPLKFKGDSPYKESISYGKHFSVAIDRKFRWQHQWDAMVETFSFMARQAKKAGLKFCVEPRVGEMLSNTDAILRMMDHVGDENFGAVLDTAHLNAQKEILALSVEKLGKRIFFVHAADTGKFQGVMAATSTWRTAGSPNSATRGSWKAPPTTTGALTTTWPQGGAQWTGTEFSKD